MTAMPSLSLHHVALRTPEFERSVRFYRDVLGLEEAASADGRALLRAGGQLLTIWPRAEQDRRPQSAGLDHLAFTTWSLDDLHSAIAHLREAGVTFDGPSEPRPLSATADRVGVWFFDPDGNRVELNAPKEADR